MNHPFTILHSLLEMEEEEIEFLITTYEKSDELSQQAFIENLLDIENKYNIGRPITKMDNVKLYMCLTMFKDVSTKTTESFNGIRNICSNLGEGFKCNDCGSNRTVMRLVQQKSGDEGISVIIKCLNPSCKAKI